MNPNHAKFDWGKTARVKHDAPIDFRPAEVVSICGITKISSIQLAAKYKSNIGDWVYTIEYTGGSDAEIPERYLEKETNN